MDKLLEFGRKALFLARVLSGYEERKIRAYRIHLQKRMEQAQAKKAELRKVPEQIILSEVRHMVEEMQALNRQLKDMESAIEDYLKPIDENAQTIMNMQLDKEEKNMKEILKATHEQAMIQRAATGALHSDCSSVVEQSLPTMQSSAPNSALNSEQRK